MHTMRKRESLSYLVVPWPGISSLQNCEKQISVTYKQSILNRLRPTSGSEVISLSLFCSARKKPRLLCRAPMWFIMNFLFLLCKAYGTQFNLTILRAITPFFYSFRISSPRNWELTLLIMWACQTGHWQREKDTGSGLIRHHTTKVPREYRIQ